MQTTLQAVKAMRRQPLLMPMAASRPDRRESLVRAADVSAQTLVGTAHECADVVTCSQQSLEDVSPDESGRAGEKDDVRRQLPRAPSL